MDQDYDDQLFDTDDIGMDDPTKVNTWDSIVNSLIQWIDGNDIIFQEVKNLSRSRIGRQNFAGIQNSRAYFDCLENNMEKSDMIEFLIHLFTCMSFWINLGSTHVGSMLREYRCRLEKCHKEHQRQGIYSDINFVGRKKDIEDIVSMLSKTRPEYKGVCVCGLGGMGKTSLAREVCSKMNNMKARWRPKKIDLREKSSLLDLLTDTLVKLGDMCSSVSAEDLQQQLFDLIKEKIYRKKIILLFDNVDDVMKEDRSGILNCFSQLLQILDNLGDTCMIRIIVTTRLKLMSEEEIKMRSQISRKDKRLDGMIQELELKPLQEKDAVDLLQKCTKTLEVPIDDKKCTEIVKLCGYSPLAIRTVSGTLKCGLISPEAMAYNLKTGSRGSSMTEILNVCHCLLQTFNTLDKSFQTKLMQLSVFHTASFNISAAANVLGEPSLTPGMPIGMMTKLDLLYLKSRHLVEIEDMSLQSEDDAIKPISSSDNIEYSIHPLVYLFLKETEKSQKSEFEDDIRKAKLKFLTHCQVVINDIGKMQEKHCLKAQKILAENRTHIINFYEMILEFPRNALQSAADDAKLDIILCNKRIAELANLILISSKQWKCLEKWMNEAKQDGDMIESMFWRVMAASKLLDMDRNEEVENYISEIEQTFNSNIPTTDTSSLPAVLGLFYLLKGRYFIHAMLIDDALGALEQAEILFRRKPIKKEYKTSLGKVLNCMGCAFYRQKPPELQKARECHLKALETVSNKADDFMNLDIPVYLTNIGACYYKEGQALYERGQTIDAKKYFEQALEYYSRALRLDLQMNAHKFDGYAQKLRNRADVYVMLKNYDLAVKDIKESHSIRLRTLDPPHLQLTITTYKVGDILRRQATQKYHSGRKEEGLNILYESVMFFDMTADLIKGGGISSDHEEYQNIKKNHMKCLKYAQDQHKKKHYEKFYRDFESCKFEKIRQRRRNIEETMRESLTREEIIAMTGQPGTQQIILSSSSSSSSQSDSESESSSSDNYQVDADKYFIDSDDETKNQTSNVDSSTVELMEEDSNVCMKDQLSSESSSSSGGSQSSSINEYLTRLNSEEGRMKRPSLLSMQSSSTEDDVFGRRSSKGSMDRQGSRDSSMGVFLNQVITTGRKERRSWLKSMESSSLEESFDGDKKVSAHEYLDKMNAKQKLKKEKRDKLLQMHKAMSFDDIVETADEVMKSEESTKDEVQDERKHADSSSRIGSNMDSAKRVERMDMDEINDIPAKLSKQ